MRWKFKVTEIGNTPVKYIEMKVKYLRKYTKLHSTVGTVDTFL